MKTQIVVEPKGTQTSLQKAERKPAALTASEKQRFKILEDEVRDGLESFVTTGNALLTIRKEKLYREDYKTFKTYLESRWGFGKTHGYNLIKASMVASELSTIADIPNEWAARELIKVAPEDRAAVAALASTASQGCLDAKWVKAAAQTWEEVKRTGDKKTIETLRSLGGYVDDGEGKSVNAVADVVAKRYEEMRKQQQRIREKIEQAQGLNGSERIQGRAVVFSVNKSVSGGVVALMSPELAQQLEKGQTIQFVIYPIHEQTTNEQQETSQLR